MLDAVANPYPVEYLLWGKAGQGASDLATTESAWHPLLCHILDVAAVAEELVENRLPPPLAGWISAVGTA